MASNGLRAAKADPEGLAMDHGHPNVLRKDPTARNNASSYSPPSSRGRLVKPRAETGDNEPLTHLEQTNQLQSKSNRLRKTLGATSTAPPIATSTKGSPEITGSRKASDSNTPPSQSPILAKDSLPKTSQALSRPAPMRSQSYSKRHASFDTPREVPLPAYPFGSSSMFDHSQSVEDSDDGDSENRNKDWAQLGNMMRDFTLQPSGVTRNIRHSQDPSTSQASKDSGGYFGYNPPNPEPPNLNRNHSAPTPPHPTDAERVDTRYMGQPSDIRGSMGMDELESGSGSESFPTPHSASEDDGPGLSTLTPPNDRMQSQDVLRSASEEGHLSTSSLPLPTSYGVEQVNRLPATPRLPSQARPDYASGWDNTQAKTPTNVIDNPFDRAGMARDGPSAGTSPNKTPLRRQSSAHRSSYPLVAQYGREIPLPDLSRTDASSTSRNVVPSNNLSSSRPFPDKPLQLPKVEAPERLLHPLLARTFSTPDAASSIKSPGVSSVIATPGHEGNPGSVDQIVESPTHTSVTDRTSNASGSSGASSDLSSHLASDAVRSVQRGNLGPISSEASILQSTQHGLQLPQNAVDGGNIRNPSAAMTVETTGTSYILTASLPGYSRDEITLSTRKKRILHIVADGFVSGCGHFERRVSFGYDADMTRIRAEFNGHLLRITVPRRPSSSASSIGAPSTAFNAGSTTSSMFWRGRSNML